MDGTLSPAPLAALGETLEAQGFALARAAQMRAAIGPAALSDWAGFADSWNALGVDTYMADGGRYRKRRHAVFSAGPAGVERKSHQPHYQSRDYNTLNGGIERWFEPVEDRIGAHPAMQAILSACNTLFTALTPAPQRPRAWHVETHQFRIEAQPGQVAKPTPEGMHRDGVDWVLVLLVRRENVAEGATSIADLSRTPLGGFTLTDPLDAALTDDNRVYHGVTPVSPLDPAKPSYRDVLVVTFRHE